jgi:hypothetical protein
LLHKFQVTLCTHLAMVCRGWPFHCN